MADPVRDTQFLVRRLRAMDLEVRPEPDGVSATGWLPLRATRLETLEGTIVVEGARFYTLGHNRLKFFEPAPFFRLPPLDVARCASAESISAALLRAWSAALARLDEARGWLEELGAETVVGSGGTVLGLRLSGLRGSPVQVRSRQELLLPSAGPLRDVSLAEPAQRRYRPLRNLDHASELELGVSQTMDHLAQRLRAGRRSLATVEVPNAQAPQRTRVLLLDDDAEALAAAASLLRLHGIEVDAYPEPLRALESFRSRSYDLALVDIGMPRMDGLEFTMRLRELAGLEEFPVVLLAERDVAAQRRTAASLDAADYLIKPLGWEACGERLLDLLEHYTRRRFTRFGVRLSAQTELTSAVSPELIDQISRGGIRLRTRRDLHAGQLERYQVKLPPDPEPLRIEAEVVQQLPRPGEVTTLTGLRIWRFLDQSEPRWVRLVETLAERQPPTPAFESDTEGG